MLKVRSIEWRVLINTILSYNCYIRFAYLFFKYDLIGCIYFIKSAIAIIAKAMVPP